MGLSLVFTPSFFPSPIVRPQCAQRTLVHDPERDGGAGYAPRADTEGRGRRGHEADGAGHVLRIASRTGTLGLHKALGMLGYQPYHMIEVATNGVRDCRLFAEAIRSADAVPCHETDDADADDDATRRHRDQAPPSRPYGRAELDKWFAGYDVVIEVPSYLGPAVIGAYAADPDVKFILTERDPDAWVRSYDRSVGALLRATRVMPLRLLQHFDTFNREFFRLTGLMWSVFADGRAPEDPAALPVLRKRYVE